MACSPVFASAGAHTDSMTYLGPYTTIASLSLGVERVFRIRPYTSREDTAGAERRGEHAPPLGSHSASVRTLNLPLPHNSLLIMHAGMQEGFKHSVPPIGAGGMDLFRLPKGIAGVDPALASERFDERINVSGMALARADPAGKHCGGQGERGFFEANVPPMCTAFCPRLPPHAQLTFRFFRSVRRTF